jgi:hypothetical protein
MDCIYSGRACVVCGISSSRPDAKRNCIGRKSDDPPKPGPGRELKSLLKEWLGFEAAPTCSCNAMARKMDEHGPEWCEGDGMASILEVMRGEHAKRWADGRTILPWTDAGARQLVLLACRRARAKAG